METRYCLDCGSKLIGRADKKFCNDFCRNNYNNQLNSDASAYMRSVNNILRRNRRIIKSLIPGESGKVSLPQQKLLDEGFNFNFHTHTYTNKSGAIYYFCYEYGYLPLEHDYFMLVKFKVKSKNG